MKIRRLTWGELEEQARIRRTVPRAFTRKDIEILERKKLKSRRRFFRGLK